MSVARLAVSTLLAGVALASSWVAMPAPASAHPLGNFTVNRAVVVEVGASEVGIRYVIDMAEIPAFSERRLIDSDADGVISDAEAAMWAETTCSSARAGLAVSLDRERLPLADGGAPELTFPPGAGGLDTIRLVCRWAAPSEAIAGERLIAIGDASDDGRLGWREVTIAAGPGIEIVASDVPASSPSRELTSYPDDLLQSPPDVRTGTATVRAGSGSPVAAEEDEPPAMAVAPGDDPGDALAGLVSGGTLSLGLLGPLVAGLLGAAHAVSPGHGKTLVAAYVIGSRGTLRHAAVLGLTVAATHTIGVFLLGAVLLVGGSLIVPEQLISWLSIAAAVLVVGLGAGMLWRALADVRHARAHQHGHGHHHPHGHGDDHRHQTAMPGRLRNVVGLGLAGGMVPSASAVIVLVVAIGTGEVLYGLALIGAFGVGMAVVLGGLALATSWVRGRIADRVSSAGSPLLRRAGRAVPFVAATAVLAAGAVTGVGALSQVL